MALRLDGKKAIVEEVSSVARESVSAIAAEYTGLTVAEMTSLRQQARKANIYVRVVRNTLARRAVDGTRFDCMKSELRGPLVLAFAKDDPGAPARLLNGFCKEHENLQVRVIAIDGKLVAANRLSEVAKLPTKDEAIARLLSVMQAPIQKFVATLAAPHTKLVRTVAAVGDKKQAEAQG